MGDCSVLGCNGDDTISFTCNECGEKFCSEHRLPESHSCQALLRSDSDEDDKIFATGLQDKDDKKRGLTDRLKNKVRRDSGKTKQSINERSSHQDSTSTPQRGTTDTNHRKYMEGSKSLNKNTEPTGPADRSSMIPIPTGYRLDWDYWKLFIDLKKEAKKAAGVAFLLSTAITLVAIPIIAWHLTDSFAVFAGISLYIFVEAAVGVLIVWVAISVILVPLWIIVWGAKRTLNASPIPVALAERSSKAPRSTGYQIRWPTWLNRLVGLLLLLSITSILVVGFTPASVPDGVPPQVAEPIEGAGAASSAFVANLMDTSPQTGTVQNGSTQTISQTPNSDGSKSSDTAEPDAATAINVARVEKLVHQKVNAERQSKGLSILSFDSGLQELARYHSEDMAKNDYFAHSAPDGETMGDRYDKFNYQCRVSVGDNRYVTGAENIFSMSFSGTHYSEEEIATETVEGWMNSPGHRENILRDYWKNEGIGVYIEEENGGTKVYVTQNFC